MAEIGAAANFIALVGAGTKLALVIFDLASRIGSAGTELEHLGKEISLFCAVTKQLKDVLVHASFRCSPAAVETASDIVQRCRNVLDKISDVVSSLLKSEGPDGIPSVAFVSKVKWTFKKPKIEMMRSTLESSKLTLQIMLSTMSFAETVAHRRLSTIDTETEDKQDQILTRGLILSQQREIERLTRLEDEQERASLSQDSRRTYSRASVASDAFPPHQRHQHHQHHQHKDSSSLRKTNRVSRLLKGLNPVSISPGVAENSHQATQSTESAVVVVAAAGEEPEDLSRKVHTASQPNEGRARRPPTRMERSSAWLRHIIDANKQDPFDPHPGQPRKRLSAVETAELPLQLLRKWTDQAEHLEQMRADAARRGAIVLVTEPGSDDAQITQHPAPWDDHLSGFDFKFPEAGVTDQKGPGSALMKFPTAPGRVASVGFGPPKRVATEFVSPTSINGEAPAEDARFSVVSAITSTTDTTLLSTVASAPPFLFNVPSDSADREDMEVSPTSTRAGREFTSEYGSFSSSQERDSVSSSTQQASQQPLASAGGGSSSVPREGSGSGSGSAATPSKQPTRVQHHHNHSHYNPHYRHQHKNDSHHHHNHSHSYSGHQHSFSSPDRKATIKPSATQVEQMHKTANSLDGAFESNKSLAAIATGALPDSKLSESSSVHEVLAHLLNWRIGELNPGIARESKGDGTGLASDLASPDAVEMPGTAPATATVPFAADATLPATASASATGLATSVVPATNVQGSPFKLSITYGGQHRTFVPGDKPLELFRQFEGMGLKPLLLLQQD